MSNKEYMSTKNKKSKCCGNCFFGAGRFWDYPIQNCMNIKTIYLIVLKNFRCKYWRIA